LIFSVQGENPAFLIFFATENMKYDHHIFICANQKAEGKKCCTESFGLEAVQKMRLLVRDAGLQKKIRIQKAGCLDVCQQGPALVIYPEGIFYGHLTMEVLPVIVDSHLKNGIPVEEFILSED
jgi:(2Fe-2S) ferredoxin